IGDRRENQRLRLFLIGVPADVGHRAALASLERIADDVRESHAMRVAARSALHRLQDRLGIRRPGRVHGGVEWTRLRPELGPGCDAKLTRYLERKRSDVERCLAGPARGGLRESGELVIHGRFSAPRLTVLSVERDRQKLALPFLCVRRQFRQPATPSGGACTLRWRFPYKR
ncbi:MAG: hypothetical protein KC609_18160, partial [Myxococcales bacterium]|nr:hypothetical protein [Myxococcales bacterium]